MTVVAHSAGRLYRVSVALYAGIVQYAGGGMIKGILTFKPKIGGVTILIEGDQKDIGTLASLYGKEVVIQAAEHYGVQDSKEALIKDLYHSLESMHEKIDEFIGGDSE